MALTREMRRAVMIGFVALVGCAGLEGTPAVRPPAGPESGAQDTAPPLAQAMLGRGDVIEVKVFKEPDLSGTYPVSFDGTITFPMIGKVQVSGKNTEQVAEEVRARFADGYINDPQVLVMIREYNSQKVHVLGQVTRAGSFGFRSGMSVIEAITTAGGFTQLAATNKVRVTRVRGNEEQVYEVPAGEIGQGRAPNFQLEPGDIVYVPETIF